MNAVMVHVGVEIVIKACGAAAGWLLARYVRRHWRAIAPVKSAAAALPGRLCRAAREGALASGAAAAGALRWCCSSGGFTALALSVGVAWLGAWCGFIAWVATR